MSKKDIGNYQAAIKALPAATALLAESPSSKIDKANSTMANAIADQTNQASQQNADLPNTAQSLTTSTKNTHLAIRMLSTDV